MAMDGRGRRPLIVVVLTLFLLVLGERCACKSFSHMEDSQHAVTGRRRLLADDVRSDDVMDAAVLDRKDTDVGQAVARDEKETSLEKDDPKVTDAAAGKKTNAIPDEKFDAAILDRKDGAAKKVVGLDDAVIDAAIIDKEKKEVLKTTHDEIRHLQQPTHVPLKKAQRTEDRVHHHAQQVGSHTHFKDAFANSMVHRERPGKKPVQSDAVKTDKQEERITLDKQPESLEEKEQEHSDKPATVSTVDVVIMTVVMAAAAGLGAVPFFFFKSLSPAWSGIATAIACGVMFAASFDLVHDGQPHGGTLVIIGIVLGTVFIRIIQKYLDGLDDVHFGHLRGAQAKRLILVVGIMAAHAIGEGCGVGVSYCGDNGFQQGILTTVAIGVHNIPEGLAKATVLVSQGASATEALIWSIVTCLPQPLMAIPSYIFVNTFSFLLPVALGFAAGCMIWMVFAELLPDALKDAEPTQVASAATISAAALEGLRMLFEHLQLSEDSFTPPPIFFGKDGGFTPLVTSLVLLVLSSTVSGWITSLLTFPTPVLLGIMAIIAGAYGFMPVIHSLLTVSNVPRLHALSAAIVGAVCTLLLRRHVILSTKLMFPMVGDPKKSKTKDDDLESIEFGISKDFEGMTGVVNRSHAGAVPSHPNAQRRPDSPSKQKAGNGWSTFQDKHRTSPPLKMMIPVRSIGIVSLCVLFCHGVLTGFLLARKVNEGVISNMYVGLLGSLFGLFGGTAVLIMSMSKTSIIGISTVINCIYGIVIGGSMVMAIENTTFTLEYPHSLTDSLYLVSSGALCMLSFLYLAVGMSINPKFTRFGLLVSLAVVLVGLAGIFLGCFAFPARSMCQIAASLF